MEERWSAFATAVAEWVSDHRLLVYIVLGILAWLIVLRHYPLESLTPVYANY
jgi:low affinity Fe/Cu permease